MDSLHHSSLGYLLRIALFTNKGINRNITNYAILSLYRYALQYHVSYCTVYVLLSYC